MKNIALALLALAAASPSRAWTIHGRHEWRCHDNAKRCQLPNGQPNWAWINSDVAGVAKDVKKARIIVHHTSDDADALDGQANNGRAVVAHIARIHQKGRGWNAIGYHYVIDTAGEIWEARPLDRLGAHVHEGKGPDARNTGSIGISIVGNYDSDHTNKSQNVALAQLLNWLTAVHKIPVEKVLAHKQVNATQCPGQNVFVSNPAPMLRVQPTLNWLKEWLVNIRKPQIMAAATLGAGAKIF